MLALVAPHLPAVPWVRIVEADALEWCEQTKQHFDCAWHDLWSDDEEPHLQLQHGRLLGLMADRVRAFQGAWAFPREQRRAWSRLLPII